MDNYAATRPYPSNASNTFVPWRDGQKVPGNLTSNGFQWYYYACDFRHINKSGVYLIENNTDSYLLIADVMQPMVDNLSGYPTMIPPFTAGIYALNRDMFVVTSVCAGVDFTTKRSLAPSSMFLWPRGSSAFVRIRSLGDNESPSVQPSLRDGWDRTYDIYDLNAGNNLAVANNSTYDTILLDISGVKSATFGITLTAAVANVIVALQALSPKNGSALYTLASVTSSASGATTTVETSNLAAGMLIGYISNTSGAGVTVSDMFLTLSM